MTVTCAHCGSHTEVVTSESLPEPAGPPDFDTRPAEPLRHTITDWIQFCPHCDYASDDISHCPPEARSVVDSADYAAVLADETRPAASRRFLAYAYLLHRLHQYGDAGWSCLHAAWVCDDLNEAVAATFCRAQAIEHWQRGKRVGQTFGDDLASEFALVTDVYRRMGEFENATVTCAEALDIDDLVPILERLLRRQMTLITARDTRAHNMKELLS
jgi:hypothetical protein